VFLVVKHSLKDKHAASKKSSPARATKKESTKQAGRDEKKKKAASGQVVEEEPLKKSSSRPENEVVTYEEIEYELKELPAQGSDILIGPQRLTRFERARIIGARSLQLSLGAPSLIKIPQGVNDSISLASAELDTKALPISIRRILPNGYFQDIPIDWLK
jgi:DNA-directed RNA polymerase I, II, and III subunit RPABC2